jgi:hypothetical protein
MPLADFRSDNLACCEIFNGCQIPNRPSVINAAQVTTPNLVLLLMPAGLLMGRPFPLGLRHIEAVGAGGMMPWLWAANGTLPVVGSVLATLLAIQVGFAAVFSAGELAYTLALGISLRFAAHRPSPAASP